MFSTNRCIALLFALPAIAGSFAALANSAPYIEHLDDVSIFLGDQVSVRVVPTDADRDVPGLRVLDFPSGAMFSDNGDGTRTFKWLPARSAIGNTEIVFEAIDALDQSLRHSRSIVITVVDSDDDDGGGDGGNKAPEIESLNDASVKIGDAFDFRVVPYDPEGVVPGLRINNMPLGASFDDNRDGTRQFRWAPDTSQIGVYSVVFTAIDAVDESLRTTRAITLEVKPKDGGFDGNNRGPTFVNLNDQFVFLGKTLEFRVQPVDDDGTVPGLAVDRLPSRASFDDNRDGTRTLRWQPYPVDIGDMYITFTAIDAVNPVLRTKKTIKITVARDPENPVNFPPVINGIRNPLIRAGDTLNQIVQPVDPDFTIPWLSALNLPGNASFVDSGDGTRTFRWPTSSADIGDHSFSFRATDSEPPHATFDRTITVTVVDPQSMQRPGERLRVLADQRDFKIGYAAVLNQRNTADNQLYRHIAAEEFNMITPENSHKMGWIQPERGVFRWEDADDLADFAVENGMVLHGHPLMWFAQLPGWVYALDQSEIQSVMREHINALAGRYRGRAGVWDVVNEAINDVDGNLRKSVWYNGMGEDYIRDAFITARNADPDAVLLYNDYDVAWQNVKSDAMYTLMKKELESGTPIDGVGFQMHLRSDFTDYSSVRKNLQRFADLGLDIYVTEFDVSMVTPNDETRQAEVYRKVLRMCLDQPKCKAVQSWGYTDRYSWRSDSQPLLLTDKYQPKPAYFSWQESLQYHGR